MMIAIVTLIYAVSKAHHVQHVNGQTVSMYEVEHEYVSKDNPLMITFNSHELKKQLKAL